MEERVSKILNGFLVELLDCLELNSDSRKLLAEIIQRNPNLAQAYEDLPNRLREAQQQIQQEREGWVHALGLNH